VALLTTLGLLAGCGGDGGTGPGALDRVLIDESAGATLFVNQEVDLRAVALDANRRVITDLTESIEWLSENDAVASVESSSGRVTANAAGITRIFAQVGDKRDDVSIEVLQKVGSVRIEFAEGDSVVVGAELTVCAVVLDVNQDEIPNAVVDWAVSDKNIASLPPDPGKCTAVRGVTVNTATLTATIGETEDSEPVHVIPPVDRVEIGSKPTSVTAGDCVALDVELKDATGAALNRAVTYESSDPRFATIDTLDTGVNACWEAPGSATITATREGKSDSFQATVKGAPLTVVGDADLESGVTIAFKWTAAGKLEQLPLLPGTSTALAKGVNDNGQIVGEGETLDALRRAFIYTVGRGIRELPPPAGAIEAEARAINNNGQVGGSAFFADGTQHMVVWIVSGQHIEVVDAGRPEGWTHANVEGINGNGDIVGTARDNTANPDRVAVYRAKPDGHFAFLRTLPDEVTSVGTAINTTGWVVGYYDDANGVRHPFISTSDSKQDAGLPADCPSAVAYGIDDATPARMAVTGLKCPDGEGGRGFIRGTNGLYTELFGGDTQARAMNARGDIAGWTVAGGNRNEAFLWNRSDGKRTLLGRFGNGRASHALALNAGQ